MHTKSCTIPTDRFWEKLKIRPKKLKKLSSKFLRERASFGEIWACTVITLSSICSKSHVKTKIKKRSNPKIRIALLSDHLTSYLVIFLCNFWVYHFFNVFEVSGSLNASQMKLIDALKVQGWCWDDPRWNWETSFFHQNFHFYDRIFGDRRWWISWNLSDRIVWSLDILCKTIF